jgi:hypothetical protein
VGGFALFRLFSSVFEMVKHRLHPEVIIRSSLPYPRFDGAFSASGGRVELCARPISEDLVIFSVRWYSFWLVSSYVRLSLLAMDAALVCWFFGALISTTTSCLSTISSSTTITFG